MARSAPFLVAMTVGLVGCVFDWASLDPRESAGSGGSGATGGATTSGGGEGGAPTTSSTGGTTSAGGAATSGGGGAGEGGVAGMGGSGGSGGAPVPECNGVPVPVLANGQTVMGSTLQAPTNFEGSCTGTTGGEIVYAFQLAATADVVVDTALPGTNFDCIPYVRKDDCTDRNAEVGCIDVEAGDLLPLPGLAAGTYFVIIDSHSISNEGNFELMVSW